MGLQSAWLAARSLRRAPGFSLVAVVLLALGVGVNVLVFSLADQWLWRPLAPRAEERTGYIFAQPHGKAGSFDDFSWADFQDFKSARGIVEDAIAFAPAPLSLNWSGTSERVWGEVVSGNYFSFLGVPLALGRGFSPTEASGEAEFRVAVISHALWQSRFAGDPGVLGRTLRVNGWEVTVVGVAAADFGSAFYPGFHPPLWLPASLMGQLPGLGGAPLETRGSNTFRIMVRLLPGVSLTQAAQVILAAGRRLADAYPGSNRDVDAVLLSPREARPEPSDSGAFRLTLAIFMAMGAMVLLIACANLASLQLARAMARARDLAVRAALGASRARLVGVMLMESAWLTLAGGLGGVLVAGWLGRALARFLRFPTDIPFQFEYGIGSRAWLAGGAVLVLAFIGFALVPALTTSHQPIAGTLRAGGSGAGHRRQRLRSSLVAIQLALSTLLLVAAGLAYRTLDGVRRVPLGMESEGRLLMSVGPGLQGYDNARTQRLYDDLVSRVSGIPGVAAAAFVSELPLDFSSNGGTIFADGAEHGTGPRSGDEAIWSFATPGYLGTAGVPLLEGRNLQLSDTAGAPAVAVVNRALAARYWPGQSAVGRVIRLNQTDGPPVEVVGVMADGKYRMLWEAPNPYLLLPMAQHPQPAATLLVQARGDPLSLVPLVRRELAALDPDLPLTNVRTVDQLVTGRALLAPRIAVGMTATAGILAVILAVVGLYGVISYLVSQQAREFAIRSALGASGRDLARQVLGAGMRLAMTGLGAGLAAGLGFALLVRGLLYGVAPFDPLTVGLVALLFLVVTLLASWLPARRAAATEPMTVLRND